MIRRALLVGLGMIRRALLAGLAGLAAAALALTGCSSDVDQPTSCDSSTPTYSSDSARDSDNFEAFFYGCTDGWEIDVVDVAEGSETDVFEAGEDTSQQDEWDEGR